MKINGNLELNTDGSSTILGLFPEQVDSTTISAVVKGRIVYDNVKNTLLISDGENGWVSLGASALSQLSDVDSSSTGNLSVGTSNFETDNVNDQNAATGYALTVAALHAESGFTAKWVAQPMMYIYNSKKDTNNGATAEADADPQTSYRIDYNLGTYYPLIQVVDADTLQVINPQSITLDGFQSAVNINFSTARHCIVTFFGINTGKLAVEQ